MELTVVFFLYLFAVGLVAEIFFRGAVRRSARDTYGIHGWNNSGLYGWLVVTLYVVHAFTLFPVQAPFIIVGVVFRSIANAVVTHRRKVELEAQRKARAEAETKTQIHETAIVPAVEATVEEIEAVLAEVYGRVLGLNGSLITELANALTTRFIITHPAPSMAEGALPDDDADYDDEDDDHN